ncbi:MAG: cell wall anchor protein, partial [Muribaculaceae bacterium]|nr:cell wall anchor protein [Muribaculaceae bacterium]
GKADTTALDNNRLQINRDITLQAFDPGTYQLPAILYVVGGDTLRSKETLTLTVDSIKVDPQGKIKDFKPVAEAPFKLLDWVPDFISDYWWAWLAGLLLLAFGLYAYFKWYKKGINPLKPVKKRLPPYEEAMQALSNLKSRNLWQNGQEKEYYTTLTDILRVYIDRRFGINAVEMTSTQIMDKIRQNEDAHIAKEQLNNVLEIADFVKFANMHTLADDNEIAFQRAVNFVEQTKPLPQPNEEDGKEDAQ